MSRNGDGPKSGIAFLLWLSCLCGLCGVHRFYLNRPVSGFFYLITFGFFGIGQVIDLFRMQSMVAEENLKLAAYEALAEKQTLGAWGAERHLLAPAGAGGASQASLHNIPKSEEELRRTLIKAAAKYQGRLSVTQAVMETGLDFKEVEEALDKMAHSGYVGIGNHPESGVVVYTFSQLS